MSRKNYSWGFDPNLSKKPTETQKRIVSAKAENLVTQLKEKYALTLIPDTVEKPTPIDIYTKWRGSYFYFYTKYQYPEDGEYLKKYHDFGLARLKVQDENAYAIGYFRHTGKWFDIFNQQTLEECFEMILNESWFMI